MLARDFDFHLPPQLIAQTPAEPRDSARLLRLQCADALISHHIFHQLPKLLRADDLVVFNDTRVLKARLRGTKVLPSLLNASSSNASSSNVSSGARIEALLLREIGVNVWECLLKPSSRLRVGSCIDFVSEDGTVRVRATTLERREESWTIEFGAENDVRFLLEGLGEVPLPPYIESRESDAADYQTVYARGVYARSGNMRFESMSTSAPTSSTRCAELDSAAAPTAGLHFTPALLRSLEDRGIRTAFVTLGIGIGTFRPMKTANIEEHTMHEESYEVSSLTAKMINAQRERGGRVVAVGTTTTRVLESCCDESGVRAGFGATSIFIRPGYQFRVVDALITNFHLPQSTLLVMISALAQHRKLQNRKFQNGREVEALNESSGLQTILDAYQNAIREEYRFFSFGDAMLIE